MQSLAYKVHAKRKRICFLETLLHVQKQVYNKANIKANQKLKGEVKNFKTYTSDIGSCNIKAYWPYHFHAILIWLDGPFNKKGLLFKFSIEKKLEIP